MLESFLDSPCILSSLCYYTRMNTPEDTSDLPDNFDPTWQEDEEIDWEYEKYLDCQIDASWDY